MQLVLCDRLTLRRPTLQRETKLSTLRCLPESSQRGREAWDWIPRLCLQNPTFTAVPCPPRRPAPRQPRGNQAGLPWPSRTPAPPPPFLCVEAILQDKVKP